MSDLCPICKKIVYATDSPPGRANSWKYDFKPAHLDCYYKETVEEDTSHNLKAMEDTKMEGEPEVPAEPTPPAPEGTPAETPPETAPEEPGDVGETAPAEEPAFGDEGVDQPAAE